MLKNVSIVVTSIAAPNEALRRIANGCRQRGFRFFLIGDVPSPADFSLDGCEFYGIDRQVATGLRFAELCPKRHYARKNIGYLLAAGAGAEAIIETDDDNHPLPAFWSDRIRRRTVPTIDERGWVNVYKYFHDGNVWPRGLPLDAIQSAGTVSSEDRDIECPIQQGLADDNPDVDAIYRLVLPLPVKFAAGRAVALCPGSWCPFNSQNTTWWADAFPLLYLPAYCSFRMTDIWRSFVAQRIAWENGWSVLFESPTVWQERNQHNLMRDFCDEVPGYLYNSAICEQLTQLTLKPGTDAMNDNLRICYEELVRQEWVGTEELGLLEAWLGDLPG